MKCFLEQKANHPVNRSYNKSRNIEYNIYNEIFILKFGIYWRSRWLIRNPEFARLRQSETFTSTVIDRLPDCFAFCYDLSTFCRLI